MGLPPPAPLLLPSGRRLRLVPPTELRERTSIFDLLTVFEPPRTKGPRRYFMGVDVSDGIGQDRSVIEIVRAATIEEPAEQVAEFITDSTTPLDLAPICHAIGSLYQDADGVEAQAVIECNNHGLSTQDALQTHYQYGSFYIWQYLDSRDQERRWSTRIGWFTTTASRPLLLDRLYKAITTLDPISGQPDLITHSPFLHEELRDFQTETTLAEAAAAKGAHDDAVIAVAVAYYASWRAQSGETEPLDERRRTRALQQAELEQAAAYAQTGKPDFRNTGVTAEEAGDWRSTDDDDAVDVLLTDGW